MKPVLIPYKSEHFSSINDYFPREWNFDFREFLSHHNNRDYFRGFSLLDGNEPIGFGNLMLFGSVCWIGNIVVSEKHRKKGLGTKITEYLMQTGKDLGAVTLNLVATELGEPIYRQLGFKTEILYEFFKLKENPSGWKTSPGIRKANRSDLVRIKGLDYAVTNEKRGELIHLFRDSIHVIQESDEKLKGYYIEGLGDGFIAAEEPDAGIELLRMKILISDRQVVLPESNDFAKDFLSECGFTKTMELPRMTLGEKCNWKPDCIYSRGTGYCG